jgi:hypothetical protein
MRTKVFNIAAAFINGDLRETLALHRAVERRRDLSGPVSRLWSSAHNVVLNGSRLKSAITDVLTDLPGSSSSAWLELAISMARKNIDPSNTLVAAAHVGASLTTDQTSEVFGLCEELVSVGIDPAETLRGGIPSIATLPPDRYAAGLALAVKLAHKNRDPGHTLRDGFQQTASLGPFEFAQSLRLANTLADNGIDPAHTLKIIPDTLKLSSEQSEAGVSLATELAQRGIDPVYTLIYFKALRDLAGDKLQAAVKFAITLAENGISPHWPLDGGLSIVVKVLETFPSVRFVSSMTAASRLASRKINPGAFLSFAIQAVTSASHSDEAFLRNVIVAEDLLAKLNARAKDVPRSTAIPELTLQAIELKQHFANYELVIRQEVVHHEDLWHNGQGIDPGWSESVEVVDDEGSVSLRPVASPSHEAIAVI